MSPERSCCVTSVDQISGRGLMRNSTETKRRAGLADTGFHNWLLRCVSSLGDQDDQILCRNFKWGPSYP